MNPQRFGRLWNRCAGFIDPQVDDIYNHLASRYNEPHRFYHTAAHIDQCLGHLDNACAISGGCDLAELAIWFHDAIYDVEARDNEQKSAAWFAECAKNSLPDQMIEQVSQCVLSTAHQTPPVDNLCKLVVDVDLCGLGQDWSGFVRDGDNIRMENSGMRTDDYVKSQIVFMEKLLGRERIYATEYFNSCFEVSARSNISRQLAIHYQHIDQYVD